MEKQEQIKTASKMQSVNVLSLVVNIILMLAKFTVGFLTGSISLVADGIHSLSDMATDLGVMLHRVRLEETENNFVEYFGK